MSNRFVFSISRRRGHGTEIVIIISSSLFSLSIIIMQLVAFALNNAAAQEDPLLIKVVTIRNGEATQEVVASRLDSNDFVNNFRISVLDSFPEQQHILNEASIADIRHAIESEIPESGVEVDYIMYDNEGWGITPEEERKWSGRSTNQAADIVHYAGYDFAASPDRRTLIRELEGTDWSKVEMLVIQVQTVVGTPEFKNVVEKASHEVRSENAGTIILVQVNPLTHSISQIEEAVNSVRDKIDGVSIVWKGDDASVLDDLLVALGR
jgi:hypothetical protein